MPAEIAHPIIRSGRQDAHGGCSHGCWRRLVGEAELGVLQQPHSAITRAANVIQMPTAL